MSKYTGVKAEVQKRYDQLFNECGVFWAFSDEQFAEGKLKHPLAPGEKYVSIGAGGYMPKANHKDLVAGMDAINAWEKSAIKDIKAEDVILHELNNFEAFHSLDLTDVIEALADLGYTEDQVRKVFNKHSPYAVR